MLSTRCRYCGNLLPSWGNGNYYVCIRNKRDSRRYGGSSFRKADMRQRHPPIPPKTPDRKPTISYSNILWRKKKAGLRGNGLWKNSNGSVVLNFREGFYEQLIEGRSMKRLPLIEMGQSGANIQLKIGKHFVEGHVNHDGSITLKRKVTMTFRYWIEGKMYRLCPGCFNFKPGVEPGCAFCGHAWGRYPGAGWPELINSSGIHLQLERHSMNPSKEPEPNPEPNPPEQSETLFGALAGSIRILADFEELQEVSEEAWRDADVFSDTDQNLTPVEQYIRGYLLYPETEEELGWTSACLEVVWSECPWEDYTPEASGR